MSAAAALECGPIDLPGPTGEANQFELVPKGVILCLGPTPEALLDQVVQALAGGNRVIALASGARGLLRPLSRAGLPLHVLDGALASLDILTEIPVDLVAATGDPAALRQVLSHRKGPIVPLLSGTIAPARYCDERTICIDTTAAGGNASLLAEAEG